MTCRAHVAAIAPGCIAVATLWARVHETVRAEAVRRAALARHTTAQAIFGLAACCHTVLAGGACLAAFTAAVLIRLDSATTALLAAYAAEALAIDGANRRLALAWVTCHVVPLATLIRRI